MPALKQVLSDLESLGTEQNRKIYQRHGASPDLYGVSYADLKRLRKTIKTDHALARELWDTGNHDARILATMIADPAQTSAEELDRWVADLGDYMVSDALSALIRETDFLREKMAQWTTSEDEWIAATGWNLLGYLAMDDDTLPDSFFDPYLDDIRENIHARQNRVRYAMNNALIAIGGRNDALAVRATEVADAIGTVEVDHGQTNCKTPDAAAYIKKTRERSRAKAR